MSDRLGVGGGFTPSSTSFFKNEAMENYTYLNECEPLAALEASGNFGFLSRWISIVMFTFLPTLYGQAQETAKEDEERVVAFPGAEGFGRYTSGGRGGQVLAVTNLNDSGPGSLREAIETKGARIIIFKTSGTIELKSPLKINYGHVTIAGQTAPGDGICLKNYPVTVSSDNVIIRFLKFRLGDEAGYVGDALSGIRKKDIIIDHCSISWGTDEVATFYDNENFTLQWCIIAEGLNASVHQKGNHGYGGIWGGMGASFHHNLLANNSSRNPRFCGARYHKTPEKEVVDFRNNVIYNWKTNSAYGGEEGNHNMVNNYYKAGPATRSHKDRIVNPSQPYGKFYVEGNFVDGFPAVSRDNWRGGVQCERPEEAKSETAFPFAPVTTHSPQKACDLVLRYAGASLKRDEVDVRIVEEVRSGKSTYSGSVGKTPGIADSQKDVGGWPQLGAAPYPPDSDGDGMPDAWEEARGLNPGDPADANGSKLHAQYDNVEVYINELVAEITKGKGY